MAGRVVVAGRPATVLHSTSAAQHVDSHLLTGCWSSPCSPARWQSQSSYARGRATNPPTLSRSPPFLLWSRPWGGSPCAPGLGWQWNGGCSTAHTVVLRETSLLPYKNHSEASTDADFAPQNSLLTVGKTYSQSNCPLAGARVNGLKPRAPSTSHENFNTSAFVPKYALLSFNTNDQYVLPLLLWFLLDLQTAESPSAFPTAPHTACRTLWAHQFSMTQILTVEWCFAPGYCPQAIICRKTNKRRTLEIVLHDTFLIPENVR